MSAETLRPDYPDCLAWPKCGREVRGHCACTVDAATVATRPVPPPSRPGAWLAKHHAIAALQREQDALWDAMTPAERAAVERVVGLRTDATG
jgi:hypothetical protein